MVVFPRSKINIGLHVLSRREDGFHDIETLFYPIGFTDILEVVPDPGSPAGTAGIHPTGIKIMGSPLKNLVVRAYNLINQRIALPAVKVFLHKVVPAGAGLGGGSADGAAMLKLLRDMFDLSLTDEDLGSLAGDLGSDCPFFLGGKPAFATGRGEILKPAKVTLAGYTLCLFYPGEGISTQEAYRNIIPGIPPEPLETLACRTVESWKDSLANVFEPYAFSEKPVIGQIKDQLYRNGAEYASMTGSGSAVYGLFRETPDIPESLSGYLIWKEIL